MMKKIALTSLFAVVAVSAANAATFNIGNPMYRPDRGDFYSELSFRTNSDLEQYQAGLEMGYGFYDWWSVSVKTAGSYDSSDEPRFGTKWNWDYVSAGLNYRWFDYGNEWKGDIYGAVAQNYNARDDMTVTYYNWTVGTRYGYVVDGWSLNAVAEAHNVSMDKEAWGMDAGLEGQVWLGKHLNIVGGATYGFKLNNYYIADDLFFANEYYDDNPINVKLGVNYNLCRNSYIGVYGAKNVRKGFNVAPVEFGAKIGIQF